MPRPRPPFSLGALLHPCFGHSGSAYGLQSGLWLNLEGGTGVTWFATGMPGEREGGRSAFSAVEEGLAH